MTRKGIESLGLECFAKTDYTWGLTSVIFPFNINVQEFLSILAKDYNLYLAGGQGHLKGKIFRIGHMGDVDWGDILFALMSISDLLKKRYNFYPKEKDFLEKAFNAYKLATTHFSY